MENEPVIPLIPLEALVQLRQLLDSLENKTDASLTKTASPEQDSRAHCPQEQSAEKGF
jgi:hypothetical protein